MRCTKITAQKGREVLFLFSDIAIMLKGISRSLAWIITASLTLMAGGSAAKSHVSDGDPYRVQRVAAQRILQPEKLVLLGLTRTPNGLLVFGEHGVVLLQNGKSWRQVLSPIDVTYTACAFSSPLTGWIIGHEGTMLRTRDGGQVWVLDRTDPKADALLNIVFLDEKTGLVVGSHGLVYRTTDGGTNWVESRVTSEEGFDPHLHGVAATQGGRTVIVVGEKGTIFRSSDAGGWEQVAVPYQGTFFGVKALSGDGVVVFGMGGHAFFSGDAGKTWVPLDTKTGRSLFSGIERNGELILAGASGVVVRCHRVSFICVATDGNGNGAAINDLAESDAGQLVGATAHGLAVLEGER